MTTLRSAVVATTAVAGTAAGLFLMAPTAAHAGYASHTVTSTTLSACNENGRRYAATWGRPVNGYDAVWFEGCRWNASARRYTGTVHFSY